MAVWRVQAITHLVGPTFACHWLQLPPDADGGFDSGEGLEAQTWDIGSARLSLGTEDWEYLEARAYKRQFMPSRLADELDISTVRYVDDGLQIPFPPLHPGELVQVHFVVAWTEVEDPFQCDTWYAVDQDPAQILRQLAQE